MAGGIGNGRDFGSFDARCYTEQEGLGRGRGVTLAALSVSGSFSSLH